MEKTKFDPLNADEYFRAWKRLPGSHNLLWNEIFGWTFLSWFEANLLESQQIIPQDVIYLDNLRQMPPHLVLTKFELLTNYNQGVLPMLMLTFVLTKFELLTN